MLARLWLENKTAHFVYIHNKEAPIETKYNIITCISKYGDPLSAIQHIIISMVILYLGSQGYH